MYLSTLRPNLDPQRAIMPVRPNWSNGVTTAIDFKTDIIETDDGGEQRRAIRNEPRREIEFSIAMGEVRKAALDHFMNTRQQKVTLLPDWNLFRIMPFPPEPDSTVGTYHPDTPLWLKPGADVVMVEGNVMETRRVLAVPGNNVVIFAESSKHQWGRSVTLHPMLTGRVMDQLVTTRVTNTAVTGRVNFAVTPGTETPIEYFPAEYVDWREIFLLKPEFSRGMEVTNMFDREDVDYGYGVISFHDKYPFPKRLIRADYIGANWEKTQSAIDFFCRQKGRQKEFLLPSWEKDIDYSAIVGGTSQVIVKGQDFAINYSDSTVFRRVMLRMRDGTYIMRTIQDIEALEETDVSVITFSEPLPTGRFDETTLYGISWVFAARFASDKMEVEWLTNTVARFRLTFQTLENLEL